MNFILPEKQPPSRLQRKKTLYKLLIARTDISSCLSACKVMLNKVDGIGDELYYPLYSAIVICYSRPFTQNKPFGSLSKRWYQFPDSLLKATHDELLKARRELIAHSDMSVKETIIVPPNIVICQKDNKPVVSDYISVQTTTYCYPRSLFENTKMLCQYQGRRMSDEVDSILEELYGGMDLPTTSFKLRMDNGL
jgi:hypothetical protein